MRFSIVTAFQPVDHLLALARAADELGYHAISVPDHVVDLEELATPYPYTEDGSRRWDIDAEWPDPWVLIGALAAVTTRVRFFTSVYVAAMRNPFQVAKSVGTAAVISGNRVSLGVGIGWCKEEFELLGEDFHTRGKRTDEGLALMKALWEPGWTEFEGDFYTAPRMQMNPSPSAPIPILIGGLSEVAFARAARHDGWVGDIYTVEEACGHAGAAARDPGRAGRHGHLRHHHRTVGRVPARALRDRVGCRDHRGLDDAVGLLQRRSTPPWSRSSTACGASPRTSWSRLEPEAVGGTTSPAAPLPDFVCASPPASLGSALVAVVLRRGPRHGRAQMDQTLYDHLGGREAIEAVVAGLYDRLLGDDLIGPVFAEIDVTRLRRHMTTFLSAAFGSELVYAGRDMGAAHAGLHITDEMFDRTVAHLVAVLESVSVAPHLIDEVLATVGAAARRHRARRARPEVLPGTGAPQRRRTTTVLRIVVRCFRGSV